MSGALLTLSSCSDEDEDDNEQTPKQSQNSEFDTKLSFDRNGETITKDCYANFEEIYIADDSLYSFNITAQDAYNPAEASIILGISMYSPILYSQFLLKKIQFIDL